MDTIQDFLTSSWFATVGTIASLIGLLLTVVSMLNLAQRRLVKSEYRAGEDSYLKGLIEYIHHLNIHSSFDEQYFVERAYTVKDKYEPRSFFMARHRSVFPRFNHIFGGSEAKKKPEGYFTKNLFREATSRNEPVIVLGDPGSGKSVSARQLTITTAKNTLKTRRPNRLIPVFISLSEYVDIDSMGQPQDFYSFLTSTLTRRSKSTTFTSQYLLEHLDYYLDTGRLFIVLDSLDEMPPASFPERCEEIATFMMKHSTNSFVITCRSNDFGGNIKGREAYLDKLTPKEIKAFIRKRSSLLQHWRVADVYRSIIDPKFVLNSVTDNPFYLNLILFFLSIKGILPENFPLLFRVVCDDWAEREIRKEMVKAGISKTPDSAGLDQQHIKATELRAALSHIAFAISSSSGFGTAIDRAEVERLCAQYPVATDDIEHAIRLGASGGMLDVSLEESKLRFVHHKFQEYFAAEFLNDALERNWIKYEDLPSICRNIWWEEVTALLTSVTDHPNEIIEVLLSDRINASPEDQTPSVLQRNYWLIGRVIHLLPNESDTKAKLIDRVIASIRENMTDARLPVILDGLSGLGEIDDQRSVQILSKYLKNSSKVLRERAFAELANFSLGQQFLVQHVYQIGRAIYFKGEYGGYGGQYVKRVRSIAFPSNGARLVLNCYALLATALRAHQSLFTLAVVLFPLNVLLTNVYCVMFVSIKLVQDTTALYLERRTPKPVTILGAIVSRSILLVLLALAASRGWLIPPFWAALTLVGIWVAHPFVVLAIFAGPGAVRGFIKTILIKVINPVSFERSSARTKLLGLQLGYLDADTYVSSMSSIEELNAFTDRLADSDFAGFELELFEAVQNAERRILQSNTEPSIFSTYEPPEIKNSKQDEIRSRFFVDFD